MSDTAAAFARLRNWLEGRVIGQERLLGRLLTALLADGHLLVEGAPGLAKTRAIRELARGIKGDFQRVQFTPDLLPGDITGTDIYRPEDGSFRSRPQSACEWRPLRVRPRRRRRPGARPSEVRGGCRELRARKSAHRTRSSHRRRGEGRALGAP